MIVRRYEPSDFDQVAGWAKKWDAEYTAEQLPLTGFIIDGHAAYFLYETDSTCCWLENMICNRDLDRAAREKALGLIVDALLTEAKDLGFKVAYASTSITAIALRAQKHGAHVTPNQMLLTLKLD